MNGAVLLVTALSLAFMHTGSFAQANDILLSQSAESESLPGSIVPEEEMIKDILSSHDAELLNECVIDKKHPGQRFFLKKKLSNTEESKTVYFLRPSIEPYCGAFYGGHIFQFWLINDKNKIIYAGAADGVTIFKTTHNGMYDIEVVHGGGWGISKTKMEFNGHEYKAVFCNETRLDQKGREVTKRVNCS